MSMMIRIAAGLAIALALGGCGTKGSLYLPQKPSQTQASQS